MENIDKWFVLDVYPDEEGLVDRLKDASPAAKVIRSDRLGGAEEIVQIALPAVVGVIQILVAILGNRAPSRKRLRMSSEVLDAQGLSEQELKAALEAFVELNSQG